MFMEIQFEDSKGQTEFGGPMCAKQAVYEMRVGPSQPGRRTGLQTALSCSSQELGW